MTNPSVFIFPNTQALFMASAKNFEQCFTQAITEKNSFSVVLSGGNTPKEFYSVLVDQYAKRIEWNKINFFFGDERYVSIESKENNYHMTETYLFSKIPVNHKQIFRIDTNYPTSSLAAEIYQNTLREVLQLKPHEFPVFDLVYLGLGEDAHTASLFPGTSLVHTYAHENMIENDQLVAGYYVEKLNMDRISLTPPAINYSRNILFMVSGKNKADAVQAVLEVNINRIFILRS